ncbi:MAG: hypothetical protein QOJ52_2316 [Acidimicrobiaceae bacterium]|nr:hypothetical protein [Acidimicrobiaceae bacterium]
MAAMISGPVASVELPITKTASGRPRRTAAAEAFSTRRASPARLGKSPLERTPLDRSAWTTWLLGREGSPPMSPEATTASRPKTAMTPVARAGVGGLRPCSTSGVAWSEGRGSSTGRGGGGALGAAHARRPRCCCPRRFAVARRLSASPSWPPACGRGRPEDRPPARPGRRRPCRNGFAASTSMHAQTHRWRGTTLTNASPFAARFSAATTAARSRPDHVQGVATTVLSDAERTALRRLSRTLRTHPPMHWTRPFPWTNWLVSRGFGVGKYLFGSR